MTTVRAIMAELGRIAAAVTAVYGLVTSGVIPARQDAPVPVVAPAPAEPVRPESPAFHADPASRAKAVREWLAGASYQAEQLAREVGTK